MGFQTKQHGDQSDKKRAVRTAIVFGLAISAISLVYAYEREKVSADKIKKARSSSDSLRLVLDHCTQEAMMYRIEAEQASREVAKLRGDEALRKYRENKNKQPNEKKD